MFSLLSQSLTAIKRQSSKLFSASKLFSSSKLFSTQFFSARGFSIVGVMVIGSMGLITMLGLAKMLSNLNEDMADFKKSSTTHKSLVSQINGLLASDCTKIITCSVDPVGLFAGGWGSPKKDYIPFSVLQKKKPSNPNVCENDDIKSLIDTRTNPASNPAKRAEIEKNAEKMSRLYGLTGHTAFQLKCGESSCDCSSTASPTYPCPKNWILSLFTMSYKNNLPVYKELLNQNLKITYNSSSSSDFNCRPYSLANSDPRNTLYGTNAGISIITGNIYNSFFGFNAGKSTTTGNSNSFFGADAGTSNTTGSLNSFFGYQAGFNNTEGNYNSFFGYQAGFNNTKGNNNSFFGVNAGINNKTGSNNSFFGTNAGKANKTGNNNSFFGFNAGLLNTTSSNRLNIANVIYGKARSTDNNKYPSEGINIHGPIKVCDASGTPSSCDKVCTDSRKCPPQNSPSSREYKKNIVPFKKEQKALSALVKTPLFTYQYKEDYPEKQRMGVISEELPKALQLPAKLGKPIPPDWPSIYGYLWAGIKALHALILDLEEFLRLGESFKKIFQEELQQVKEPLQKKIYSLKRENQNLKEKLEEREKSNRLLHINIQQAKQKSTYLKQEMALIKKQEDNFKEELKKLK